MEPAPATPDPASSGVRLSAEFAVTDKDLVVAATIRNGGVAPVFVLDSPWRLEKSQPVSDSNGAYRFESRGTLRLLLGAPPTPSGVTVSVYYDPFATRVDVGKTHELEIVLALPIEEYNPYFPRDPNKARFEDRKASRLELVVQYVTQRSNVVANQAVWTGSRFMVTPVDQLDDTDRGEYLRAASAVPAIPVRRRIGPFTRTFLPGDSK
jgi:hypothetical protein